MVQIQSQDAMEAAVAADDKDKLQEALQADEAQVSHDVTGDLEMHSSRQVPCI